MGRTYVPKLKEIQRQWFVVDASNIPLGRLASRVATLLRGKHKPSFTPHLDVGDHVVIVNAEKVRLTGNKLDKKIFYRHSRYPGGLTAMPYRQLMEKNPQLAVEKAVRGMLPKNRLGRAMAKKLKVYRGPDHPHQAQRPQPLDIEDMA